MHVLRLKLKARIRELQLFGPAGPVRLKEGPRDDLKEEEDPITSLRKYRAKF